MQQRRGLADVADVGRRADDGVHQARLIICTNVGFHAKVPFVAFLGLVHVGVAFARCIFGRAGRGNQCGIH